MQELDLTNAEGSSLGPDSRPSSSSQKEQVRTCFFCFVVKVYIEK